MLGEKTRVLEESGWLAAVSSAEIMADDCSDLLARLEDIARSPYELRYALAEMRELANCTAELLNEATQREAGSD